MHALRHFYASTLLSRAVSIKELAEYLGHADAGFTLSQTQPGQATNANWNGTRRFLGRSTLIPNNTVDDGSGVLKAVFEPFLGNGGDGALNVTGSITLSSDTDDGVFEYTSVTVNSGAILKLTGSRPVVILCQGAFTVNGTIDASGSAGGVGIDTTNYLAYVHMFASHSQYASHFHRTSAMPSRAAKSCFILKAARRSSARLWRRVLGRDHADQLVRTN